MNDEEKSQKQLITELTALRLRVEKLEAAAKTSDYGGPKQRFQQALLQCQSEAALDGILVVSSDRTWLSFNQRFVEMWKLPEQVVESRSSEVAIQAVLSNVVEPEQFTAQIDYLYQHPDEKSQDEVALKDGRTFHRYSAPVCSSDGIYYGRVWYYRDISARKQIEQEREALIASLQQSLEKIRVLSGLLPICAWCRKIQDDQEQWQPLEAYLAANADVDITHGICPDCYKKTYSAEVVQRPKK